MRGEASFQIGGEGKTCSHVSPQMSHDRWISIDSGGSPGYGEGLGFDQWGMKA